MRFSDEQDAVLKRIAGACGVKEADVARWAVEALGDYWTHHGNRLLLPLRFHETFFVYQTAPPRLNAVQQATVITDAEGRVLEVNQAFSQMCGYSLAELHGKKPGEVLQGPQTEPEIVRAFHEAIRQQRSFECTITNYHKNGTAYRVHIKCDPIFDGNGQLVQFRAVETLVGPPPRDFIADPLTVGEQRQLQAAHRKRLTSPKKKPR